MLGFPEGIWGEFTLSLEKWSIAWKRKIDEL